MRLHLCCVVLISSCLAPALADFLGPRYPAPKEISSDNSLVAESWKNLSSTLNTYTQDTYESTTPSKLVASLKNITFSLGMFSLHDAAASKLQFHYTSHEIAKAANGTHKVDGDSIYRVASVTKAFTVLAGLLNLKDSDWDRPLTDINPTFAGYARNHTAEDDPIYMVEWDKITPRALSAQIAGVPRDGFPNPGEILLQEVIAASTGANGSAVDPTALGFPPPDYQNDPLLSPPCLFQAYCGSVQFIEGVENRAPVFLPWTTPAYSDNAFSLLGVAISNITGKPIEQLYRDSIFEPLSMTSSNSSAPPESEWDHAVIPGDAATTFVIAGSDIFTPSGGLLSTTNDLAKFGVGILNSTLMSDDQTRKWMKPTSHTARPQYSLGRPWEIIRYTLPSGAVTDFYTKSGDSGLYSAWFVLLPDYDAGFSILTAGTDPARTALDGVLGDLIAATIVPALEAQAAVEAQSNFAGTYTPTTKGLNSSLTLALNKTKGADPGLAITSFISNGTNVLKTLPNIFAPPPYRLLPSISDPGTGQVAFRMVGGNDGPGYKTPQGTFSSMFNSDWIGVDAVTYGGIGISLFVADVDSDGKAEAMCPAAFRVKLKRDE